MKIENFIPDIYYKESRDFAFIGRLIEIVINYMKMSADNVDINLDNETIDNYLLQLLADTLGFKSRHNYDTKDLIYICSSLYELYRKKGSMESIIEAIQLLLNSQAINQKIVWGATSAAGNFRLDENDKQKIILEIPEKLEDLILIEDLFDYILPAGMLYTFIKVSSDSISSSDKITEIKGTNDIGVVEVINEINKGSLFETHTEQEQKGIQGPYLGNIGSTIVSDILKEETGEEENE